MDKNTIDTLYNQRKADSFLSENYEFTKKHAHILRKPKFTIKKSKSVIKNLTYRQVNDWDSKNLISSSRKTKDTGWRKFSVVDIIKLYIISDLRKIGFHTERIKTVIDKISAGSVALWNLKSNAIKTVNFLELEYCILACFSGVKMLLLIREKEEPFFLSEKDTVFFHFCYDNASSPVIILPFFVYAKRILDLMKREMNLKKDSTIQELFTSMLTEKERKILEIIRSNAYQEILLKKSNKDEIIIRATARKSGNFSDKDVIKIINKGEYQNLTVITEKGRKITLVKEDRIRI